MRVWDRPGMRVLDRVEACMRWVEQGCWPLIMAVRAEGERRGKGRTAWWIARQEMVGQCKRTGTICKQASKRICMTHGLDVGEGGKTHGVLHRRSWTRQSKQVAREHQSKHQGNKSGESRSIEMENNEA